LIPPSEFDMKFFYRGKENPNIPPIGTCVLKSIQTNYAPRGFAAYESFDNNSPEKGGTGMPVAITMTLSFSETTYLTKEDYSFDKNDPAVPAPSFPKTGIFSNYMAATSYKSDAKPAPANKTTQRKKNKTPSQGVNTSTGVDAGIAAGKKTNATRAKAREDNRYLTKYGLTAPDLGGGAGG
jgi:hypothetical protein